MNFRQRVAWLLLFGYLFVTGWIMYYFFDLSERYSILAHNHDRLYHSSDGRYYKQGNTKTHWHWLVDVFQHLSDVPFFLWVVIALVPYLQGFWMLYICTHTEPRLYFFRCLIPVLGVLQIYRLQKSSSSSSPVRILNKNSTVVKAKNGTNHHHHHNNHNHSNNHSSPNKNNSHLVCETNGHSKHVF